MTTDNYKFDDQITVSLADTVAISDDTFNINLSSMTSGASITSGITPGIYTTTGTNTSPYNYNYNWPTISTSTGTDTITLSDWGNLNPGTLDVRGDANFEGDVKIKGKSLVESLEKIEEKLAILRPNEQLEEKWDQLRQLRKQYMELEKEIIEKEKMWDILKK